MDLPLYLETEACVVDEDELHQTMMLLLKSDKGTFLQNFKLGSQISPHISDMRLIHSAVLDALSPIKLVKVEDVIFVNDQELQIVYKFRGDIVTFNFNYHDDI